MHKINLQRLLRTASVLIIFLSLFLYNGLIVIFDDIVLENRISLSRKKYEYTNILKDQAIPDFLFTLESLFLMKSIPVITEAEIVTDLVPPLKPPTLQFVGMIETDNKIIYSFRNMETDRLMLFEEGVVLEEIIMIAVEETKYTFKRNETVFQVDKK